MIEEYDLIEKMEDNRGIWEKWDGKSVLNAVIKLVKSKGTPFYTRVPTEKFFELLMKWKHNTLTVAEQENLSMLLDFKLRKQLLEAKLTFRREDALTLDEVFEEMGKDGGLDR